MDSHTLLNVLENTVSLDQDKLQQALRFLEAASNSHFVAFCEELSKILSSSEVSDIARRAAGIQLKNQLFSNDAANKEAYHKRWLAIDEAIRISIKEKIILTLGTEKYRPSAAAQCIAAIACAELPVGQWPNAIDVLCEKAVNGSTSDLLKEATIEAIGYICQDMDSEFLQSKTNEILTAIVTGGMRKEEENDFVKFAAVTALLNSLEFTKNNFEREPERNFIMQVVCETTQHPQTKIKVVALQCLVKILTLYYKYMEPYMGPAIFPITLEAMKSSHDEVVLQGIEFWSSVCDEEVDLALEAQEAAEQGIAPTNVSKHYAKGALPYIAPLLLFSLTKTEDSDDDDDWNPSKAASVCLMLLSSTCENDILPHILPFVEQNLMSTDWKFRDAAIMAFGSCLEGPDMETLRNLAEKIMNPHLINLIKDHSPVVQDTAAWAVGRVCEIVPEIAISSVNYLVHVLLEGLSAEPRVAANICWAFNSLAEASYENAFASDKEPETTCLSPYFEKIVEKLIQTTDREDCSQNNLRSAAYEALMELIKNSPKDCYPCVQKTTITMMERTQQMFIVENDTSANRNHIADMQSLLCATLQSVMRKMRPEDALQIADPMMVLFLKMLSSPTSSGDQHCSGVHEDALLAVATIVETLGSQFGVYMNALLPHLHSCLRNTAEYQVCICAVGLVGDLSRALGHAFNEFCPELMQILLEILRDPNVHRLCKPPIIAVFGDIALAIGVNFMPYLSHVLPDLQQASSVQVNRDDYEMVDYLNEVRESCLEAYTGIIQGLKGENNNKNNKQPSVELLKLQQHAAYMITFIEVIAQDEDRTDSLISACCGLVGDLLTGYGSSIIVFFEQRKVIKDLLAEGRKSKVSKTKNLANWAAKEMKLAMKA